MKSSTYYFHMKMKILAVFQICISVPLTFGEINFAKIHANYLFIFLLFFFFPKKQSFSKQIFLITKANPSEKSGFRDRQK